MMGTSKAPYNNHLERLAGLCAHPARRDDGVEQDGLVKEGKEEGGGGG